MKKIFSILLIFITISVSAQKGVVIPTTPVTPQKSQSVSKPKPVNTAPKPAAGTEIWKVDATSTPCTIGQCMLIKKAGQKEFEIFEDVIEGFEFTEGNTYTLQVRQTLKQPPIQANESIYKYELVKVITSSDSKYSNITVPAPITSTGAIVQIDLDYGTIACESGSEKQCFLLKEKGRKEYEIFNGCIYGFTYEAGNRYILQARKNGEDYDFVKVIKKEFVEYNPTRISCVNQRNQSSSATNTSGTSTAKDIPATNIPTSSALDKKWYLRKMKESEGSGQALTTDDNVMWIEINTFNDKLKGFGSCNNFEAVVRTDLVTSFQISKLTSGYVNCGYKKIEDLFYSVLQQADRFEIRNGNLILSKQWKYLMELTSNPNQKEETNTSTNYQPVALNSNTVQPASVQPVAPVTSNNTSPVNVSAASITNNKEVDDLQKQVEELQKQLEKKKQQEVEDAKKAEEKRLQEQAELVKQIEIEAKNKQVELEKQKKIKEIEELKKQLAEREKDVNTFNTTTSTQSSPSNNTKSLQQNDITDPGNTGSKPQVETQNTSYKITTFATNNSNKIPDPEYSSRPYYIDGSELKSLERVDATFDIKNKLYAGVDMFYIAFKPESSIQFKQGNLPRMIIKIDNDVDPNDILQLSKAIELKDRRRFQTGSMKLGGKAKDVSNTRLSLDFKKISDGIYEIILPNLEVGEYGFLPISSGNQGINPLLGGSNSSSKINCFGVAP